MMSHIARWLFFALTLSFAFCQGIPESAEQSEPMPLPALPFYDWNVCPGEGCTYGQWIARKSIAVYDVWKKNRRLIARLSVGDKVTGVTGIVITFRPGMIEINRDLPDKHLKSGDTLLTYTYRGEVVS